MKQFHSVPTQFGTFRITFDDERITAIELTDQKETKPDVTNDPAIRQAEKELLEYFQGNRSEFSSPVSLNGNRLQLSVWHYLQSIPYGTTVSYTEVADAIGCRSVRAAATAVARNPVPILIPCHRVIRKDGSIGNYSMGGMRMKKFLLNLEKAAENKLCKE